ncbi:MULTISPECIES: type I-E CRISPR-associated protein Cas5/CasD [Rhodomicrobium]|uniref:type I-E CRISPR-associated protein Cas5/CasD n=1 Tax=Rhodomicrobium TaxID=1068 RepID=UPI000B4A9B54|nr:MULTISPECIES: type I-E CRISPR-associated protein Cas5/CasD [Rhodomicrobium]
MMHFLLFTLAAPFASFGAVAVGGRRPSWDRPAKSQVIGLLAAALGIPRIDEERQLSLAGDLEFAVRVDDPGRAATDFQTAQAPSEVSMRRRAKTAGPIRTRGDELDCDELKTILSRREYRLGSHHTIAIWRRAGEEPSLTALAAALRRPAFTPYAGRKAHPLMWPMAPALIEAEGLREAFAAFDAASPERLALWRDFGVRHDAQRPIFTDLSALPAADQRTAIARLDERRDEPENRAQWRFGLRTEAMLQPIQPQQRDDMP